MNDFSQEASEAGEVPGEQNKPRRKTWLIFKGLTTPGTAFTSPWMDSNRSPDPCFVNTVNQIASAGVNTNERPDPNLIIALSEAMSPTDKIDSWFASNPAGPSQPSTSRPRTRDTALPAMPIGASTSGPSQVTASSHLAMRDPFFDTVPKGPSQPSTSRWNARLPVSTPWAPTRDQPQAPLWNKTEASVSPEEELEEIPRPRLKVRIPDTSAVSDNFRSAPQMATHSEVPEPQADAPHTTGSLIPVMRLSNTVFQSPQRQALQRREMLNPAARPFQSKFSGPRAPARRNNNVVIQPSAASHTNSRTWTSDLVMEKERWQRVEESLGRMNLLRSSVIPKTLKDWLVHQRGRADAKREREQTKLDVMNRSLRDPRLPPPGRPVRIGPAFRGRTFEHKNHGSVLVVPTVWARTYEPPTGRLDPLWPCAEEMKEEGDERNTSGFRRFPALPRVPGNDTVQYKLKAIQPFLPFDAIWELPTRKTVEAAKENYSPEESKKMEGYLGRSLLDALNCITDDNF